MFPLSHTGCSNTADFLERAVRVAEFYGFIPIENVPLARGGRGPFSRIDPNSISFTHKEERALIPVVHRCAGRGMAKEDAVPSFIWRRGPGGKSAGARFVTIELHIIGVSSSVAEALLIAITNAIAQETGIEERVIGINSLGSGDSSARYLRELSQYLRKHTHMLPDSLSSRIAMDPIGVLLALAGKKNPIAERAPQMIEYLNEDERQHLWGVLEYLEATGAYYELNPSVLGSRDCWSHTIFEMCGIDPDTRASIPFARGGRYDALLRRCAGDSSSAVSVSITCEAKGRSTVVRARTKLPEATLYFAHLGLEAKRRIVPILESLRLADIPVRQSIHYEQLADQMIIAKSLGVRHMLIMGHKEAVEGDVLVRDTQTNSQVAIPTKELIGYLKRHRIGVYERAA